MGSSEMAVFGHFSIRRSEDSQAQLCAKILASFQFQGGQTISQIHCSCRGEMEKLEAALKQLEEETKLVSLGGKPLRCRVIKTG
jgi:hypothetical protein